MRQIGPDISAQLAPALMLIIALVALPCAILLTLLLIRWFRSRVARSMQATAATVVSETSRRSHVEPAGALEIAWIEPTITRAAAARAVPVIARARRYAWRLAAIYAAATATYAFLLATGIMLVFAPNWAPNWYSILAVGLLYVVRMTEMGTPVALAPTVVLKKQPRFLILAVLALIAVVWVVTWSIGVGSIKLWLKIAAVPTAAVLLLNVRRLRAVGPIVFAAVLLLLYGVLIGLAYGALYAMDVIGPVQFVREDLAGLPLGDAAAKYFSWLASLPLDRALAEFGPGVAVAEHPERFTTEPMLTFFAIWLATTVLGVVAAWSFVRWLARRYRVRRASDQMLTVDVLMVIFATPMLLLYFTFDASDWPIAAGVLAGLAGYKLVAGWGLRHRRRATPPAAPRTLLLLRVFGFDRRTQRLLDDLGQRWRYLGPIHLIGGSDLAYATIEPHEFFEFLNGRLSRAFIKSEEDLESRLAQSTATPDPDGLFRVDDFFCHEDSWRMTVSRLAREAAAVLMDLRGFGPANRGCIFEIEELIAAVPVERIVLLVDPSTDLPFLEQTLQDAWQAMPDQAPNVVAGQHRLRILHASSRHGRTLATLLGLLCEVPGACAAAA
jgi:hypothetical protein